MTSGHAIILLRVLILWNGLCLAVMAYDKAAAKKHMRRISEKTLIAMAFALGSLGIWLGMSLFRHKTRHRKFTIGVPLAFVANALIVFLLWRS